MGDLQAAHRRRRRRSAVRADAARPAGTAEDGAGPLLAEPLVHPARTVSRLLGVAAHRARRAQRDRRRTQQRCTCRVGHRGRAAGRQRDAEAAGAALLRGASRHLPGGAVAPGLPGGAALVDCRRRRRRRRHLGVLLGRRRIGACRRQQLPLRVHLDVRSVERRARNLALRLVRLRRRHRAVRPRGVHPHAARADRCGFSRGGAHLLRAVRAVRAAGGAARRPSHLDRRCTGWSSRRSIPVLGAPGR